MSWIRSADGTELVNLEHAQRLGIAPVAPQEGESEEQHGIFAYFPTGEHADIAVYTGTEADCLSKLESIAKKLPMVRE